MKPVLKLKFLIPLGKQATQLEYIIVALSVLTPSKAIHIILQSLFVFFPKYKLVFSFKTI